MVQHIKDQVILAGQAVDRATLTGLKTASVKSGVSFQYLLAKAAQESSLKSDAQADGSTATGLFQFTRGTWLEMIKRYGAQYGYGDLADKISTGADGKTQVKDPAAETQILNLRQNPEASALMAAAYARDNAATLEESLGHDVDPPDLYLAHFLGPTGAGLLLSKAKDEPDRSAASLMPAAAKANPSVFYGPDGKARSAADVVALVRSRFSAQMTRYGGATAVAAAEVASTTTVASAAPIATSAPPAASTDASTPFDFKAAMQSGSPGKMMQSWFVMQELAKLIAQSPMTMSEGSADTGVSSGGLQGADWTSAMTTVFSKDAKTTNPAPPAVGPPATPADQASRAYDAVKGQIAALLGPRRNDLT